MRSRTNYQSESTAFKMTNLTALGTKKICNNGHPQTLTSNQRKSQRKRIQKSILKMKSPNQPHCLPKTGRSVCHSAHHHYATRCEQMHRRCTPLSTSPQTVGKAPCQETARATAMQTTTAPTCQKFRTQRRVECSVTAAQTKEFGNWRCAQPSGFSW